MRPKNSPQKRNRSIQELEKFYSKPRRRKSLIFRQEKQNQFLKKVFFFVKIAKSRFYPLQKKKPKTNKKVRSGAFQIPAFWFRQSRNLYRAFRN